jgi:methionine biosynthesis protein MetW
MISDFEKIRPDHRIIYNFVQPRSNILDLGCGNGELLSFLIKEKDVRGQGIEIDEQAIYECVAKGLNVFHGDIDSGLAEYSDKSFDYVILNQTLQQVKRIRSVLDDALRVGKHVIVGLPNFAFYKARLQLFFLGRAPVTPSLPFGWHDSPNLHFSSIRDFIEYSGREKIMIEQSKYVSGKKEVMISPNLFAQIGIFLVSR